MPKRPRQHQIEDISRAKFKLILPDRWVERSVSHDYGIDCEVEIFDEDERAVGLSFLVQLKSTENSDDEESRRVTLKVDSIKYFLSKQTPVLIVRYDVTGDVFYCRWAGNIDLHKRKKRAKTHSFVYGMNEILTRSGCLSLERDVRTAQRFKSGKTSIPVRVNIDVDRSIRGAYTLISSVRTYLSKLTNGSVTVVGNEDCDISCIIRRKFIRTSIGTDVCCEINFKNDIEQLNLSTALNAVTLGSICFSPIKVGRDDLAARLVLSVESFPIEQVPEGLAFKIVLAMLSTSHYEKAFDLIEILPIDEKWAPGGIGFLLAAILSSRYVPSDTRKLLTNFLLRRIEVAKARGRHQAVGIAHYNLANHFSSNKMYRRAIENYRMAVKLAPTYSDSSYVYREIGGVLFSARRYRCAKEVYGKAWNMKQSDQIGLLYADSMMMAGNYSDALRRFIEICEVDASRAAEWRLKIYVLDVIVNQRGLPEQKRKIFEAQHASAYGPNFTADDYISNYWDVVQLDALSPMASVNYAISISQRGRELDHPDWKEAYFGFLVAALVCTNDLESWTNCVICLINCKELWAHLILIVEAAYFFMGDEFLYEVTNKIHANINNDAANSIISEIEEFVEATKNARKHEIRLRFLNDAGEVVNVVDFIAK